eukprot:UN3681
MSASAVQTHPLQVHADGPRALHMNTATNSWFRPCSVNTAKRQSHAWCRNAGYAARRAVFRISAPTGPQDKGHVRAVTRFQWELIYVFARECLIDVESQLTPASGCHTNRRLVRCERRSKCVLKMTRDDWRLCFVPHQWSIVMSANDVPARSLQVRAGRSRVLRASVAGSKWFRPCSVSKAAKERIRAWCRSFYHRSNAI